MTATLLVSFNFKSELNWFNWRNVIAFVWKKASQVKSLVLSTERMTSAQILPQLNRSINKLIIVFSTCDWTNQSCRPCMMMLRQLKPSESLTTPWFLLITSDATQCVSWVSLLLSVSTGYLAGAIVALAQLALHCHPPQWANEIGSKAYRRSRRTPQRFRLQVFQFQSSELTPAGSAQWFMSCVNIWNSKDSNIHLTQLR